MTSVSAKNGDLSIVFSIQGTGCSPTGPDSENRVGDQDTGSLGRPVSCGLQVPVSQGIVMQEQGPLRDLPQQGIFPSKCLSIASASRDE